MKKTYTYSIAVLMLTLLKSIELIAQCPANVTITNGTGTWVNTASTTATVRITAVGAGGGKNTATTCSGGTANSGGSGATMVGQFTVASGATLYIIAGQAGVTASCSGGGGGGSGVVNCGNPSNCGAGTILIVAGGGGGTSGYGNGLGGNTTQGTGNGGAGFGASSGAAGGGGFNSAGGNITFNGGSHAGTGGGQISKTAASAGGVLFQNGGTGGSGMGGGGGGQNGYAGGGGGYSGGDGESTGAAKGGGSYNVGTNQSSTAGTAGGGANSGTVTVQCLSVLPIELAQFDVNTEGGKNNLTWRTESEKDNKYFDIERSTDGKTFHSIGQVKGNNKPSSYQFVDNQPFATSYYRLRQIDFDGTETFSKIVSVQLKGKRKGLTIYPTLVSNGILTVDTEGGQLRDFSVMNLLGQQVLVGKTTTQIDVSSLSKGTYVLKVGTEMAKFVKQ